MNITYFNDGMYLDAEKLELENPAEVYAEILVNSIMRSLEYSPRLQHEFFERLRPAAAAYYDWRIMPIGKWAEDKIELDEIGEEDDIEEDDIYDPDPDEDQPLDEYILDNLLQLRVSVNTLIDEVASSVFDDDDDD